VHDGSEIMDCVACESCKVHAKLNILGIGTALKILFSAPDKRESVIHNLQRNEIIVRFCCQQSPPIYVA
jgi:ERO1-like protein alpha